MLPPLSRSARVLFSIAMGSLVAMVLLYAFPSHDPRALVLSADACWTWAAAFAAVACFTSSRRVTTSEQRRAWRWIGAGCASFLAGQLVWNYFDLVRGTPPPYPSLADIGYLGIYVCLIAGVMMLVRGQTTRRGDPELFLDAALVTFAVGALAYEYLLEPLLTGATPVPTLGLLTSIAWSAGAVAVLWMILIQMLRRPAFPAATAALVLPSVIAFGVGNQVYAVVALRGTYRAGGALDLTWDAGLLLIGAAAAIAPDYALHLQGGRTAAPEASAAARFVALVLGLAAMTGMAIVALMQPAPPLDGSRVRRPASRARIWWRRSTGSSGASRCRFTGPTAARGPARCCSHRYGKGAGFPRSWRWCETSPTSAARKRSCSKRRSSPPWVSS